MSILSWHFLTTRHSLKDEDSEQDEQRMVARRRFSYENIDGVGDDASSDSRGKTDHDSTDDISKVSSLHISLLLAFSSR